MSFKKLFIPALLVIIPLLFFYKTLIFGQIPFPGDLLLGNYEPYRSNTYENFGQGVPHKGQGADVIRELYPWKKFSIDALKSGYFPFWNPYVFSGNTHFANLQSGVFYPVNFLFFIFPFIEAWTVYIILQYVFLFIGTYLFLRQIKLTSPASLLGAVAFSFSGFFTVWGYYGNLGHTMWLLPFMLYFIEKIFTTTERKWYFLLVFFVACSIFAGYVQLSMYILMLSSAYTIVHFFMQNKKEYRKYVFIFLSLIAGVLFSAVQLIPLYEALSLSLRSNYTYSVLLTRLMPPESVITLLAPDFFGNPATNNYFLRGDSSLERAAFIGVWPLIFAVLAILSKKTFHKRFFVWASFIIILSVISIPPVAYFHSIGIPFLSTGIPTRALSIMCFCLAVLGSIGADKYIKGDIKKRNVIITLGIFSLIFVCLWALTYLIPDPRFHVSRRNLILPTAIFFVGCFLLFTHIQKKIIISMIIVLTIIELFYSFQKFNSFVPKSFVYPKNYISQKLRDIQGIDRFWGYGSASIDTNYQIIEKIYGTDGYDPLFSKQYGELTNASKTGSISGEVERSVANIFPGYGVNELKQNPFRQRILDLAGVKYVLNIKGTAGVDSAFSKDMYDLQWEGNGWQIYRNRNVLDRIMLFGKYKVQKNTGDILKTLYSPDFNYHKILLLEEDPGSSFTIQNDAKSMVKVLEYTPNRIKIQTNSSTDQLLFVSDNYFPGWRATVDGKDIKILRANYTFRAVPVKKGEHIVVMSYLPKSFIIGVAVSATVLAGLLIAGVYVALLQKRNKK